MTTSLNDLLSYLELVIQQLNRLKEAEDIEHKLGAATKVAPETLLKSSDFIRVVKDDISFQNLCSF